MRWAQRNYMWQSGKAQRYFGFVKPNRKRVKDGLEELPESDEELDKEEEEHTPM